MSAPTKDEEWYQRKFRELAHGGHSSRVSPFIRGSKFFPEVPFDYSMTKGRRKPETPGASFDFIELDVSGKLHLWELKTLHAYELTSGRVLGQLMFYDWMFRSSNRSYQNMRLRESGIELEKVDEPEDPDKGLQFESWNILVCGGYGYEIAAGVNPIMWEHNVLSEKYFDDYTPKVSTFHLYHDQTGRDEGLVIRNIWRLSILNPTKMEPNALIAYLRSEENWLYTWRMENEKFHLVVRPDDFPKDAIGLANEMPENSLWELGGREHLLTGNMGPPPGSDVRFHDQRDMSKIRLDWQGPVWTLT